MGASTVVERIESSDGTVVISPASGRGHLDLSVSGGAGGPFLPLSAGAAKRLTGGLYQANATGLFGRNVLNTADVAAIAVNNGNQIIVGDPVNGADVVLRTGGVADIAFDATAGTGAVFATPFLMVGPDNGVFIEGGAHNAGDVLIAYDGRMQLVAPLGGAIEPSLYFNDLRAGGKRWKVGTGIVTAGHYEVIDTADTLVPVIDATPGANGQLLFGGNAVLRNTRDLVFQSTANVTDAQIVEDNTNTLNVIGPNGTSIKFTNHAFSATNLRITDTGDVSLGRTAPAVGAVAGFPYAPAMAGAPTGVPTGSAGYVPFVVDTTNNQLCFYYGGAWKKTNLA